MLAAGDDAVDVPVLQVMQIFLRSGSGAKGDKAAPVGQASHVVPGADAPAAVGYYQKRSSILRIRLDGKKSALVLRRRLNGRFKKCLRAGQGGVLFPGRSQLIVLLQVQGKAFYPS